MRLETNHLEKVRARFDESSIPVEKQIEVDSYKVFVTSPVPERRLKSFLEDLFTTPIIASPPVFLRIFNLEM